MRSLVAFLAGLIAVVGIVAALPSLWVSQRVISPTGFTATAQKMADSSEVRTFMADTITDQIGKQAGSAAGALARPFAVRYTSSEGFTHDFVDLAEQQHRWLFDSPPPGVDPSVMRLDLTNMVRRVAGQVNPSLAAAVPGPILVAVSQRDQALEAGRYHDIGRKIPRYAYGSAIVALIAALVALLFSRRRAAMLAWLGFGGILSGAVAWAGGYFFASRAKDEFSGTEAGVREVAQSTINGLVGDLHEWALIVGGAGAVLLVVGLLGRVLVRD